MPKSSQIELSDGEKEHLKSLIEMNYGEAVSSHTNYAAKCARWMQKWEGLINPTKPSDIGKPNHVMPLIQWQCFNKLARDMQALLGEEAEITAKPTGPSDVDRAAKVGRWMTSRVFDQMKITAPLCEFAFRRILNGWSAAYRPWYRDEYSTLDEKGREQRVTNYEGPGFFPLEPDDLVIPPERGVRSIQEFAFVIRKRRVTVDDLYRNVGDLYQGTSDPDFLKRAIDYARSGGSSDVNSNPVRTERERSEGVAYDSHFTGGRTLLLYEWYGYWRPVRRRGRDAEIDDLEKRLPYESDYVVRYLPGMREIVGCQDLLELYPKMRHRRPFCESTLIKDGTYRSKGFGALLNDLEDDTTANSRHFAAAGELSVWPITFYKVSSVMKEVIKQAAPGQIIPCEDPASVNVVKINPNLDFLMARQQDILSVAERVTGITDQSLGRAIDRPNAPRTATGQLALIEEGNVRAYLDSAILRDDMERIIEDFWDMDVSMLPEREKGDSPYGLFFRVTEQQSGGLFDVKQGGAFMRPDEFAGKYDFSLKFATSVYSRQAKKAETLAFYQAAVMNPLCMQNPTALWGLMDMLAKSFNIDFETIIPKPPELDMPKTPDQEWTLMLEGEQVQVNPQDNDDLHLQQHAVQLEDERKTPDRDVQAIGMLVKHMLDHQQQKRVKQLMQVLTNQVAQSMMPPQQSPAQQTLQDVAQMYGGQIPGMEQPQGPPQPGGPGVQPGMMPGMQMGGPGEVPPPPNIAGSQQAPQPVEGMM